MLSSVSGVAATTDNLLLDKFQIPRLYVQRASLVPPITGRSLSVDELDGSRTFEETKQKVPSPEGQAMEQVLLREHDWQVMVGSG